MSRSASSLGSLALSAAALFSAATAMGVGIPPTGALTYSGQLEENGAPVQGVRDVTVALWNDPVSTDAGAKLCATSASGVSLNAGRFMVVLDDACTAAAGAHPDVWVDLAVDGVTFDRDKLGAVPYAVEAAHAEQSDRAESLGAGNMQLADDGAGSVGIGVYTRDPDAGAAPVRLRAAVSDWGMFEVDWSGTNAGALNCQYAGTCNPFDGAGLVVGGFSSGEGLGSQRGPSGPNPLGLDFYTHYQRRMSIDSAGNMTALGNTSVGSLSSSGLVTGGAAAFDLGIYVKSDTSFGDATHTVSCNGSDPVLGGGAYKSYSFLGGGWIRESRPADNGTGWVSTCVNFDANGNDQDIPCQIGWAVCAQHVN